MLPSSPICFKKRFLTPVFQQKISTQCIKMSSVLRSVAQKSSKFFWVPGTGADLWSLDDIKAAFRGENGSGYSGPEPEYRDNYILFATEDDFKVATYELLYESSNTYYASNIMVHKDLGKDIFIGVNGIDSQMLTMSLVGISGSLNRGYGLTAMNVSEVVYDYYDGDIDISIVRGAK